MTLDKFSYSRVFNVNGDYHWSPLESIGVGDWVETHDWAGPDGASHWSPLELEIEKTVMAELIQMALTIGAHWSPLELEIEKGHMAELI